MIVTLTPNPSVDRTVHIGRLEHGRVVRATGSAVHPSGKGVNVARVLTANGIAAQAVLPVGGAEGEQLTGMLSAEGIAFVGVPMAGTVRVNVSVAEADGTVTKLNERGPALTPAEVEALLAATLRLAADAAWVVGSGSLPAGAERLYLTLIDRARDAGVAVAIDTRGEQLAEVVRHRPDLVKPNLPELAIATRRPLATLADAAAAARALADAGARAVLASLGPDGALLVQDGRVWHGEAATGTVRSTVGAGDALLAGFLAGGACGPAALTTGLAWAAATCRLPDSGVPAPVDINPEEVCIHAQVDGSRPLASRPLVSAQTQSVTNDSQGDG